MTRMTRWMVPLAAVALLGAGCGGGNGGDAGGAPEATDTLSMVDNAFAPETFSVSPGTSLNVTNDGQALHSFTVTDEGIDEDVQPGERTTVEISLSPGTYDFICKYHPEMTGSMTVE